MRRKAIRRVRPGDPITAEDWNELVDAVRRNEIQESTACGLSIQKTPDGTLVRLGSSRLGRPAVTSSTITARSGTTPGTGTVTPLWYNGSALANDGSDLTVLFYSASASIGSGKYCWIQQDQRGIWWLISAEC